MNMATGIADIQTVDWTVDIPGGSFTYHCDQHASLTGELLGVRRRAARAAGDARPGDHAHAGTHADTGTCAHSGCRRSRP